MTASWQFWTILSAGFAALAAIFAKIGAENVGSDFATFVRAIVILAAPALLLTATRSRQSLSTISGRSLAFLVLSGCATGASWICYFRALIAAGAVLVARRGRRAKLVCNAAFSTFRPLVCCSGDISQVVRR